ncbi:MAG TPA: zinc-dependent peptidase [Flavipsychrobacter sp.]|nr:zinc-dependent peptidase [Flavipsychrobacter sp.]
MQLFIVLVLLIIIISGIYSYYKPRKPLPIPKSSEIENILAIHVEFYQQLSSSEQLEFLQRVEAFLAAVKVTGVNTVVETIDKVFVAAGAIIPIFAFKNWRYKNISEVLLYPYSFSKEYQLEGEDRNILGMVGEGALQNTMILSQQALRNGFLLPNDKSNTAIHEFVHLFDKSDGDTDGEPEVSVPHQYAQPWLKRIYQEMQLINTGRSDINPYAATNEAEFLAVASEYFFEQPHQMQKKHPELYEALVKIFHTDVVK